LVLKLNRTFQHLTCADDVYLPGGNTDTIGKKAEILIVLSKEFDLGANA
jgi:hypothetical protein